MRNKLGIALMALGLVMLAASVGLLLWNQSEANRAETASRELLDAVSEVIVQTAAERNADSEEHPEAVLPSDPAMKEAEVNGHLCVGYLSIPRLQLELPILASCTNENLKISSCRYSGTTIGDDLVLAGHNYQAQFGVLHHLKDNDEVVFVDMDGIAIRYQVSAIDVVAPDAVEEVTSGQFDLALFTCTYGGKTRLVVYCDRQ